MNEPRRLREESPSDLERALLNAGTTYRCSSDARSKTLAALGLAGSAALSAGAVSMTATSVLAKWGWPKLLLAVSLAGAVTTVPVAYHMLHRASPTAFGVTPASPAVAAVPAIIAEPAGPNEPSEIAPLPESGTGSLAESDNKVVTIPVPKQEPKGDAPSAALSDELNALDTARAILAQGNSKGALSRLDAYNKTYSKGRLQLEAEVLRIDALTKSGQTALAKKRGDAFLHRHPNSVLASRVRALLGN